jgi:hypothetical protein
MGEDVLVSSAAKACSDVPAGTAAPYQPGTSPSSRHAVSLQVLRDRAVSAHTALWV